MVKLIDRITYGRNLAIQKVRDRESEIRKEDLTPEAVYNNYRKIAKDLIEKVVMMKKWIICRIRLFRHCRIED